MSSSDKIPDWNIFSERQVPFDVKLLSPAMEMSALLQKYRTDMNEVHQEIEAVRNKGLAIVAQQAVYIVQLADALDKYEPVLTQESLVMIHKHLRILKDQMLDSLEQAELEVTVPIGKALEEIEDFVQVQGWRHHEDFSSTVVAEVLEPIVTYHGKLVRQGRVVMGAPLNGVEDNNRLD